jgi:hypothetical protein
VKPVKPKEKEKLDEKHIIFFMNCNYLIINIMQRLSMKNHTQNGLKQGGF